MRAEETSTSRKGDGTKAEKEADLGSKCATPEQGPQDWEQLERDLQQTQAKESRTNSDAAELERKELSMKQEEDAVTRIQLLQSARKGVLKVMTEMHTERGFLHKAFHRHQPPWFVGAGACILGMPLIFIVGIAVLVGRALMKIPCIARNAVGWIPDALHETLHVIPDIESLTLQEFLTRHGEDCSHSLTQENFVETVAKSWVYPWHPDVRLYWFGIGRKCSPGPKSEYFDATKPSIIYVHGWQPGTTLRGFRETLNFVNPPGTKSPMQDTEVVDLWVAKGYNIGIFYWNQLADEPTVAEAERKIFNTHDGVGLRWRRRNPDGSTIFVESSGIFQEDHCVSDMLVKTYLEHFSVSASTTYGPVHIIGHSLGAQLTLEFCRRLLLSQTHFFGTQGESLWYPQRLTLIDPFFTRGTKDYGPLDGISPSQRMTENIHLVREALPRLLIETYETSLIGGGLFGGSCPRLKRHTIYHVVDIQQISWTNISLRHCCSPFVYMCSLLREDPVNWRSDSFNAAVPYDIMIAKMPPHATHKGPMHDHLRVDEAALASATHWIVNS